MNDKIYPRTSDNQTVYLKNIVTNSIGIFCIVLSGFINLFNMEGEK